MTRVLVYGTLRRGERANHILKGCDLVEDGVRVPGFDMFRLFGFPGVKENKDNKEGIVGEVYEVDANTLSYLDFYEGFVPERVHGNHFVRQAVDVNGTPTDVYVYDHDVDERFSQRIPSGNWREGK